MSPVTALDPDTDWAPKRPTRRRFVDRLRRGAAAALCAVALAGGGLAATGTVADAIPGADKAKCSVTPDMASYNEAGLDAMRPSIAAANPDGTMPTRSEEQGPVWTRDQPYWDSQYTLYEVMGTSGLSASWTSYAKQDGFGGPNGKERNACADPSLAMNSIANGMLSGTALLTDSVVQFRSFAVDPKPVVQMLDNLSAPVEEMRTGIYVAGVTAAVSLVGLWLILSAASNDPEAERRKPMTLMVSAAMLLTTGFLLTPRTDTLPASLQGPIQTSDGQRPGAGAAAASKPNFYWITVSGLDVLTRWNGAMSSALLSTSADGTDQKKDWCALPDSAHNRTLRMTDCAMYRQMALEPWMLAQFGSLGDDAPGTVLYDQSQLKKFTTPAIKDKKEADIRLMQLHAQGKSVDFLFPDKESQDHTDAGRYGVGSDIDEKNPDTQMGMLNHVREAMWTSYNGEYSSWQGTSIASRIANAGMGLVVALLVAAFSVISNVGVALWNSVLVLLFYALPVAGLLGIIPWTQRVMLGFLSTWGAAFTQVGIYQLVQPVSLLVLTAAMALPVPMMIKAVTVGIFGAALFKMLGMIGSMRFAPAVGGVQATNAADAAKRGVTSAREKADVARRKAGESRTVKTAVTAAGVGAAATAVTTRRKAAKAADAATRSQTVNKGAKAAAAEEVRTKGLDPRDRKNRDALKQAKAKHREELNAQVPELKPEDYKGVNPLTAAAAGAVAGATASKFDTPMRAAARKAKEVTVAAAPTTGRKDRRAGMQTSQQQYVQQMRENREEQRRYEEWAKEGMPSQWLGKDIPKSWLSGGPKEPARPGSDSGVSASVARKVSARREELAQGFDTAKKSAPELTRDSYMQGQITLAQMSLDEKTGAVQKARNEANKALAAHNSAVEQLEQAKASGITANIAKAEQAEKAAKATLTDAKRATAKVASEARSARENHEVTRRAVTQIVEGKVPSATGPQTRVPSARRPANAGTIGASRTASKPVNRPVNRPRPPR